MDICNSNGEGKSPVQGGGSRKVQIFLLVLLICIAILALVIMTVESREIRYSCDKCCATRHDLRFDLWGMSIPMGSNITYDVDTDTDEMNADEARLVYRQAEIDKQKAKVCMHQWKQIPERIWR